MGQVSLTVAQLGVDKIAKELRYNSRVSCVEGSLSAKIDAEGTITVLGKYELS